MMLCAVKIDGAKRLLFQLFLSDRRESVDRDERACLCTTAATSLENCGLGHIIVALRPHYCDYYHCKLQAALHSGHLLGVRPGPQMKLDPVHWSGGPTWAVSLNYKR